MSFECLIRISIENHPTSSTIRDLKKVRVILKVLKIARAFRGVSMVLTVSRKKMLTVKKSITTK